MYTEVLPPWESWGGLLLEEGGHISNSVQLGSFFPSLGTLRRQSSGPSLRLAI